MKILYVILKLITCIIIFNACNEGQKRINPETRPIVEAVYASGKLVPESAHKLFAMNDGIITEQNVEEGTEVKLGDVIFSIDHSNQQSRYKTAFETYRLALNNAKDDAPILSELKNQVESLRSKLANDSTNFERYKSLWNENVGTKADFDRASLAYKVSKNDYESAIKRYKRTKSQLQIDLQNAKTQQDLAAKDLNYTYVKSDIDGTLFETYKKQGESVRRNDPVAYIGKSNAFYLQLWIDEEDINKVKAGQKAKISIDMDKGIVYDAVVTKIYPILTSENQSVKVEAKFTGTLPEWVANASAEANIIISEKAKALTIPKSLLVNNDSVWVENDKGEQLIKIEKGIETIDFVEVLNGLDANSKLIKK